MAIKQVFIVKDEILKDEYKLSGQSGCLRTDDDNILLIDTYQVAQNVIEACAVEQDGVYVITKEKISAMSNQVSREISNLILDSVYENAISNAEDDEEMEVL